MKKYQHLILKKPKTRVAALALGAGSLALSAGLINIATPNSASAAEEMAEVYLGATNLTFEPYEGFEKAYLRISGPEGYRTLKAFESGEAMTVDLLSPDEFGPADGEPGWDAPLKAHVDLAKGRYRYEIVYTFSDGRTEAQSGSFFANDGIAFESPQAAGLPIPPRYEGLPGASDAKTSGDKVGTKFDANDLVQILDDVGDDQTQLFWGNANFANWRLDNRSGDLTAERFDGGGVVQMTLLADGDFGLRTAAPSDDLHIVSDDGTPSFRMVDNSGEEDWQIVSGGASTLQFDYEGILGSENDILTIAHTGNVGVGTGLNPEKQLHVQGNDTSALTSNNVQLRVENTSGTVERRDMLALSNNGGVKFTMEDRDRGEIWDFSTRSNGFNINLLGTGGQELLVTPLGEFRVGPGGVQNFVVKPNGDVFVDGSLVHSSSREAKKQITPVDGDTILAKLDRLEVAEWSYKDAIEGERHLSPMAEEFHGLFGLGPGSKHVSPSDLAGVALAAAKALKNENESLKSENRELRARLERIESKLGLSEE